MQNDISKLLPGLLAAFFSGAKSGAIVNRQLRLDGEDYFYQVYLPPNAATEKSLPLLVFLHGIRERGTGGYLSGMFGTIIKQYLVNLPAIVLLPQCRPNAFWSDVRMDQMVMRQIEAVEGEFSIDDGRKYLMGVSMGGYGVWHFAAGYPKTFAALVSICGGSPLTSGNRFQTLAEKVGQAPAWLFYGAEDRIVPVSESRNLTAAIRENGGSVRYSEYANVGHNVWLNALGEKDLLPWLLSQEIR